MSVAMIGPKFYAWDKNGKPLAFGKLYTYQTRTNTPKPTYQSEDQVVENTNPVILNGEGYANVYLDGSYKMVLKDDKDNEIWSSDPVTANQAEEWVNCVPASYVSTLSFRVAGNLIDKFEPGRRVRIDNNAPDYSYATIETSVFASGETTVTITAPVVTTGISGVCVSILSVESFAIGLYTDLLYKNNNGSTAIENMFEGSPVANAVGDICSASGSLFIKESEALPVSKDNYIALNNPSIFAYGGKVDGVTDDTEAFLKLINSGHKVVELGQGTMVISELSASLTNDLTIKANDCLIKLTSQDNVRSAIYLTVDGYNIRIDDVTLDADNKAHQCLRIQNESSTDIKDVELNNVKALNAYRSSQNFQGGDGIFVRGGFRRVIMNNPEVKNVKMASGAGIPGSEGVSGITVVQNFAQTLMPRYVEINNPYVEDVYSEDNTYTGDQDGAKFFGIDTEFMEEGSCRINGGSFKNCFGRSLKFQRPDAVVNGTTFIRDQGNASGGGNSEVDFQRGGGTVRDIICKYKDFHPGTIINTYQNQYDTYKFLVDGVSVSLEGATLTSIVQRFSQATPDKAIPVIVKNVNVIGSINQVLRYLTQNSSASDRKEQAVLENIYFEQADFMAQVYGNNTGQRVDVYAKNVNTSGSNVSLIDEGTFSNAVSVRLYQENNKGFGLDTDSTYIPDLVTANGTVTLDPLESTLDFTRNGRICRVAGSLLIQSGAGNSGVTTLTLPTPTEVGTQASASLMTEVFVSNSVSKAMRDFAVVSASNSYHLTFIDVTGNNFDATSVGAQLQAGTRIHIDFTYKTGL